MTKMFRESRHDHTPGKSLQSLERRAEHDDIRDRILHLRNSLEGLAAASLKDQRKRLDEVIAWLEEHIEIHTRHEDNVLFPAVESRVGKELTAALRVEHRFIARNFDVLRRLAAEPTPRTAEFVRVFDNLSGLFDAHFEAEEEVLSPILDQLRERGVDLAAE